MPVYRGYPSRYAVAMGDWNLRQHWFRGDDADVALAIYQRLEAIGRQLERDEPLGGATGLRFGFVSPTLVSATTTQKWGDDGAFAAAVVAGMAGVLHIEDVGEGERWSGGFGDLAPGVGFAWCRDGELREQLAAQLPPLRLGKAVVYKLPDEVTRTLVAGRLASPWSDAPPSVGKVVFGLTSPHGLLALGTWEREAADCEPVLRADCQATRLVASRLAGGSAWAIVSGFDHAPCLPDAGLHHALARHGPRALWRAPGVRRSWGLDLARRLEEGDADREPPAAAVDVAALRRTLTAEPGSAAARHAVLALGVLGDELDRARLAPGDAWLGAHARWALGKVPDGATAWLPALCGRARGGSPDPAFARRAAEIAHGWSRSSYWMVRDGAPGPDLAPLESARRRGAAVPIDVAAQIAAWDGKDSSRAARITMWCDTVLRSLAAGDELAVLRAVVALDNAAAAIAANGSWWSPPLPWVDHVLVCAWDGDDGPPAEPTPELELQALTRFYAAMERAAALANPRERLAAYAAAEALAGGSRRLAREARDRALAVRCTLGAPGDFQAHALAQLAELPPPLALDPDGNELAMTAWLANAVAWLRYEARDLAEAAPLAARALACSAHDNENVIDTWVRVQLGLGNLDGAYAAVARLVRVKPEAAQGIVADLVASPGFLAWRSRGSMA